MLGLPKSTEMSKQLPKKAVYAKIHFNTAAKEKIDADISKITIVNEVTPDKIHIPAGEQVFGIFVLHVMLKRGEFDVKTIETLFKLIPQNILFVLEYEGKSKLAIYHINLLQTDWQPTDQCHVELRGLSFDKIWENLICDVGGLSLKAGNTLDEQILAEAQKQKLGKEIARLEKQARTERQPKKKFEMVQRMRMYRKKMEGIDGTGQ